MHYSEAEQKLEQLFESRNYKLLIQQRLRHVHQDLIYTCSNGAAIYISYPGLKARIGRNGKIVYDYRVDIVTSQLSTSLSHANIIVDIYNKCLQGFDRELMKQILIGAAREGQIDVNQYSQVKSYSYCAVNQSILRCAMVAHTALGKSYNSTANQSDLTFEELFSSIFWIVLQEDINYPMPRYQGRKMPFSRYLEALHCFESDHTLDEVISRALVEGYPPSDWIDMDYSFRRFIN
ncbi:MAG: hypothetical protein EWV50_20065 [Microcystis aeruginosa Ma_MB_F_20061100_S20]|uniref:Uncharacterized protein n=1 Tax=Microcystis aeruginosa Ma_MB_F_20061100_S20D TaxID=2486253 RepID=A0A552F1D9_MICAE|nr:MAG: hypothetical protein EWV50_20065 [Microcystis aeruginosa Ma_MB_F_20061100_S20]TRU40517.1 MAG: hypothetical protein EWV78_00800 [Microcystis aeruginosa Ma_MB_F_20061100_S20D]